MENKCRVEMSDRAWRYLLDFIARAELHLLLRAINVNLQVIVDNKSGGDGDLLPGEQQIEEDEDDEVEHDLVHNLEPATASDIKCSPHHHEPDSESHVTLVKFKQVAEKVKS